jgi:phage terminase large subunit-like protein
VRDYEKIANQYALDVVTGAIPASELTKLTFKRHLSDLERSQSDTKYPYLFNPLLEDAKGREYRPGNRICAFGEKLCHTKGVWKGRPIVLEPWQIAILVIAFGWISKESGLRRFSEIYGEIPRKNGKSVLGAIIGLFMFLADGEGGPEVYSGATSQKQALEVFRPAWLMVKNDPELQDYYGIQIWGKKADNGSLTVEDGAGKFEPLIGNPGDGSSPHCYLCDEYHEHPDDRQYDSMATGMDARAQPMIVIITTAGTNLAGPCYSKRNQVVKMLNATEGFENDSLFGIIYTPDEKDKWYELDTWIKVNPNYGVSIFEHRVKEKLKEALQRVSKQPIVRCKRLNQWMNAGTQYFDLTALEKSADPSSKKEDFAGCDMFAGLDIASKRDLAGYVNVFRRKDGNDWHYHAFCNAYLPDAAVMVASGKNKGEKKQHYHEWREKGWLTVTDGARTDIQLIQDDMEEDSKKYNFNKVGFDPHNAGQLAVNLDKLRITMVEVRQGVQSMSEPTKELDALIRDGKFHYDGNPVLTWCLSNICAKEDKKSNVFPYKEHEDQKIDLAIALIIAISLALISKEQEQGNDGSLLLL